MSITLNLYSEFDRLRFEGSAEDQTLQIRSRNAFVLINMDKAALDELQTAINTLRAEPTTNTDHAGMP